MEGHAATEERDVTPRSPAGSRTGDAREALIDARGSRRRTVPPGSGRRTRPHGGELRELEPVPGLVRVGPPTADLPEVTVAAHAAERAARQVAERAAERAARQVAERAAEQVAERVAGDGADATSDSTSGSTSGGRKARRLAAIVAAKRTSRRRTWGLVAAGTIAITVAAPTLASQWHGSGAPTSARLVTAGEEAQTTPQFPTGIVDDAVEPVIGKAVSTEMPDTTERTESDLRSVTGSLGLPLLSGLPWASGVYIPGSSKEKAAQFAAWRGRPVDVVVDWSARQNWNDIVNPTWLYDAWQGTPYTKVFGVAPIPEDGSGDLQSCASGAYDDKWREFGTNIKARGLAEQSIIRLGWEFNGDWYAWAAHDAGAFAACFRKVVTAAESTAPELRWDWTVNRGKGQSVEDARNAYPGDAYVDIVGIDSYDMWPGVTSESDWNEHLNGAYGLKFWVDFATQHGKKVSIPEWGVYPGTAQSGANGGDNPLYITKMHEFFVSLGDKLAYESYFNEDDSYYAGSLFGPTQNPAAADKYSSLF